ncbi:MAG: DEAD/DEAH box helicase family protein, partial [Halobacteriovoraceae bacterium]|nr:DEAD/DEAH box helicase family protein [Halobacteriovoraceae bacterium]
MPLNHTLDFYKKMEFFTMSALQISHNSFQDVLKQLREKASNPREQGDYFESLICEFLKTYPLYKRKFKNVWKWYDWPDRQKRLETGIDIVAESHEQEIFAIQCKFNDLDYELQKGDIDSFLSELGKKDFDEGMIFTTTKNWSKNAEKALKGRSKKCVRIDFNELKEFNVDWKGLLNSESKKPKSTFLKKIRPDQQDAINNVIKGFEKNCRGKMIMPCGTGKTFTSLKIAEKMIPEKGSVLFLAPSLSLISQTLREWSNEAERPINNFVVCSDSKVGKNRNEDEDIQSFDLILPPTTKYKKLAKKLNTSRKDKTPRIMNIVYCTYQSIKVVSDAQIKEKISQFDLIICDEAHRTTGIETSKASSSFTKVHDKDFIKAKKRLYMTATPRIYSEKSKKKARENEITVFSMDDEKEYGSEFYRMDFSKAIEKDLLVDYKVCIFTVNEEELEGTMASSFSQNREVSISDAAKIIGCWNALAKRSLDVKDWVDKNSCKKAVAFLGTIKKSKNLTKYFNEIINTFNTNNPDIDDALNCIVHHVDGTQNALIRNDELRWLKADSSDNECRILSNARCLSEGIDVPALDAVMFLNPRKSEIDIVQSVGRVMRKAEGRNYGYIILPIIIKKGVPAHKALDDNTAYSAVWQVLQALRSHDDRFNAMVNQIELNKKYPSQIIFGGTESESDSTDKTD